MDDLWEDFDEDGYLTNTEMYKNGKPLCWLDGGLADSHVDRDKELREEGRKGLLSQSRMLPTLFRLIKRI